MVKLNQFFDHVKERLSNPLFYSFLISWIFCNWEIVVALLWYDPPASSQGHLSLIEYIVRKSNNKNSILYPFVLAVAYTMLSPIIRNLISALQVWSNKWGEAWNLRILKGSKVPIDKYLSFKTEYEKRSIELEKAISSESATIEQLEQTRTALLEERNQVNKINHELSDAQTFIGNLNNVNLIDGRWIRTTKTREGTTTENIQIQNNAVYIYKGNSMEQKYSIYDFHYHSKNKSVCFTLFHFDKLNPGFFSFNRLVYRHKGFSGTEYGTNFSVEISYTKDDDFEEELMEEEENQELTNRDYWVKRGTSETVKVADEVLELVNQVNPGHTLKYNKFYIGMTKGSDVDNFVIYRPKKDFTRIEFRIQKTDEIDRLIESSGLQKMDYEEKWNRYRIKLKKGDVQRYNQILTMLITLANDNR